MSLNLLWTELLDKKQRPPGLKFPLEKKLKEGRGSKSRAGFGNSCSASMQGLYGAAHGPPWQQHRPPAERKDVRWQSWRGSVQQAAAGQLTCREKRRLIEERGGKQRRSYLQSKFNMKSNWNYNKTHLTVNSGSKEWAHMQDTWILPNKENKTRFCCALQLLQSDKRNQKYVQNSKYTKSSIKSWTRCLFLTCTKAAIRINQDAATSVAVNTSTRPQVRLAENLLEFRELAIDYRKYIFSL